jgi:hypothetical protein
MYEVLFPLARAYLILLRGVDSFSAPADRFPASDSHPICAEEVYFAHGICAKRTEQWRN